ncbi:ATP-binding protein [Corynebacterium cystitidis]|uniref:ATP-binding protein n=1 Tax=Corynebacterium cystitidis TaxID=35757 RepID=UPI00211EA588|nr:DUF4143 domain-containing protein [Corynebacterium cystitidis]
MKKYIPRLVDNEVQRGLKTSGALLLQGPRACGKTSTAKQCTQSSIQLDRDTPETMLARNHPALALEGAKPRLLDECQAVPGVWNEVRHAVDEATDKGLFILTGSATPEEESARHSGAGRIRSVVMRTLSLAERQVPAQRVSLEQIIADNQEFTAGTEATVEDYAHWIVASGFPEFFTLDSEDAHELLIAYLDNMSEHDYPLLGGPRRDPRRFWSFLQGYAGLVAQPATGAAIRRRIGELSGARHEMAMETVNSLHDFATRLYLVEDQPAWATRLRSRTSLVQMPKRHLADPGLAVALLGAGPQHLLSDPETLGILFESMLVHDLRVYAQALRARGVFHLRDTKGRQEMDAVLELRDGTWIGFEAKLSHHQIDQAAEHLKSVATIVERPPAALLVIIPTGPAYQRSDGVWVVPLAALGP